MSQFWSLIWPYYPSLTQLLLCLSLSVSESTTTHLAGCWHQCCVWIKVFYVPAKKRGKTRKFSKRVYLFRDLRSFLILLPVKENGSKTRNHIPISCVIHGVICVTEIQYLNLVLVLKRRFFFLNSRFHSFPSTQWTASRTHSYEVYFSKASAGHHIQERQLKLGAPNEQDCAIRAGVNYSTRDWQQQLHRQRCVSDISSVNSRNGPQILLSMTTTFMSVTTCLFFGITFAVNSHKDTSSKSKHLSALKFSLIWASVGIFRTRMITSTCNAVAVEAELIAVLLQKLLLQPSLHLDIVKEFQLFLQQVRIRPVRFTASNVSTIGHPTLCSFTGAVATYLVILLQFHT